MYQPIQLKTPTVLFLVPLLLACFVVQQTAQAVVPPPDGGYPHFTTAEGDNALRSLTTGVGNTAIGTFSLSSVTTGSFNTAVGAGALDLNTADNNTATGAAALLLNTGGHDNTANGVDALALNDTGNQNTAIGAFALFSNTEGSANTATGYQALISNTEGGNNTAVGVNALPSSTGSANTALGAGAGIAVTTASDVICIAAAGANVTNSCFVGNIRSVTTALADAIPVMIDSHDQLGTMSSSRRFKKEIQPMDHAGESILALTPVMFHYKSDNKNTPQFGLVAEEVAQVNPDLVLRDKNGEIYTVRYDAVNAMLLNEFLKEHREVEQQGHKIEGQDAIIAQLKSGIAALTATVKEQASQIQKVSGQLDLQKPVVQTVVDND